jgi:small subunit ribosomal protein S6
MTKDAARLYEGMYILSTGLSEEARQRAFQKIEDDIAGHGGEIAHKIEMGRRRLAYDIRKHRDGHFYLLYFKVKPSALTTMHEAYHLMEDLLRFMTLSAEKVMEKIEFKQLVTAEERR